MRRKTVLTHHKDNAEKEKLKRPVRVDSKTVIFVCPEVSDKEAIKKYNQKMEDNRKKFESKKSIRWE